MSNTTIKSIVECPKCGGTGGTAWQHQWSDGLGGGFAECRLCLGAKKVSINSLVARIEKLEQVHTKRTAVATARFELAMRRAGDLYVRLHQHHTDRAGAVSALKDLVPDGWLAHQGAPRLINGKPPEHNYVRRCADGETITISRCED